MTSLNYVKIVEVSARDGLQNEVKFVPTEVKVAFINELSETGLSVIEVGSFVSPKWVPQLADSAEVYKQIDKKENVAYPMLVPNVQGLNRAIEAGVKEVAVFTTPSEKFSQQNTNSSVAESLTRIASIVREAKKIKLNVRGYISCVLGCPYEGKITAEKVADVSEKLIEFGCDEISLGDTIGTGTVLQTKKLIQCVKKVVPIEKVAVHFHDTYGQALTNIYVALEEGVRIVDSSVAGIGGCPYAKGASGNVATEDVIYMLKGMNIETGVNLQKLIAAGKFITKVLNRAPQSKLSQVFSLE